MGLGMSALRGEADGNQRPSERPLIATSGPLERRDGPLPRWWRTSSPIGPSRGGGRACCNRFRTTVSADDTIALPGLISTVLAVSALTGTIAWEPVNPLTVLNRGVVFGTLPAGCAGGGAGPQSRISDISWARASSISSAPAAAITESPTGRPSTSAAGRLTWAAPVPPAMQVTSMMRRRTPCISD